jgi:hypothetical protein
VSIGSGGLLLPGADSHATCPIAKRVISVIFTLASCWLHRAQLRCTRFVTPRLAIATTSVREHPYESVRNHVIGSHHAPLARRSVAAEQGPPGHDLLLGDQDPRHHGRGDRRRLPEHATELRPDEHDRRREAFYWLTILFTFALGTAAGDLAAETLSLGYLISALVFALVIGVITMANRFGLNGILAFWAAYILTRPLGASLGDALSQPPEIGGLGLGTIGTSALFLLIILGLVSYLAVTRRDVDTAPAATLPPPMPRSVVFGQVVAFLAVFALVAGGGFAWRSSQLTAQAAASSSAAAPLGDLSAFRQIVQDTLGFVQANDVAQAKTRVADLETAWDNDQAQLKPMNPDKWTIMDGAIDTVLKTLRAPQTDGTACRTSLQSLLAVINTLDPQPSASGG